MWRFYKALKKNLQEESKKNLKPLEDKIDEALGALKEVRNENIKTNKDTQKEILRLQILDGIEAHRLSASEVQYFYDKYHRVGGNSFVTEKVHKYLRDLEEESEDDEA